LLLKFILYVPAPLHTPLPTDNNGADLDGGSMVIVCALHEGSAIVTSIAVPVATPLIVPLVLPAPPPVTVPADAVIIEALVFAKLIVYVAPLQLPAEKLADGVAQAVLQSTGLFTVTTLLQPPRVAVMVTLVPTGIPVTVLPLTVPTLAVTVVPADAANTTV
jgi:hypothetical protein